MYLGGRNAGSIRDPVKRNMPAFTAHIPLGKRPGSWKVATIELAPGESAYVAAPSGCGKTRAARQLCGLDHSAKSNIAPSAAGEWQGKPVTHFDARTRAVTFAIIPSNPQLLFSMIGRTLRQELELAFGLLGREIDFRIIDRVVGWFDLGSLLDRDYRQFSGGEQVRAALACVLVKKPKVLITDQVADQIDPDFRTKLSLVLSEWSREEGAIAVHFATTLRDEFACGARQCVFFTGEEMIVGTPVECWQRLGCHRVTLLDGSMRLGALLQQEALASFDSMPFNADSVAASLRTGPLAGQPVHASQSVPPPQPESEQDGLIANIQAFAYAGGTFRLRDVKLQVARRTLCAALGPNGAGKTTLLKVLANLLGPWEGTASINGFEYDTRLPLPKTARSALYCFQNPDDQLYRATVAEELVECASNLTGATRTLTKECLRLATAFGLEPYLQESPFELPLSLRRLLVIAGCLIARPPLLLMDEPTVWLDFDQKRALKLAMLDYLDKGGCALAVSHDLDWISGVAASLVFLDGGTVIQHVASAVLSEDELLPYEPTCLKVAERLPSFPKLWREEEFLNRLRHA